MEFNEAKSIGASIYIWAIIDILIEILGFTVKLDPENTFIVHSVGNLIINHVVLGFMFVTKVIAVLKSGQQLSKNSKSTTNPQRSDVVRSTADGSKI
ncbi:hypothetical protein HK096_003901 [Nowakowskiella sp. JEL0078]|nr:hypothetical protein HK096_003901 [Nowakowskiella sp. JEL0078]